MNESKIVRLARKASLYRRDVTYYVLQKDRDKVFTCITDDIPYWLCLGYQIIHVFVNGKEIIE